MDSARYTLAKRTSVWVLIALTLFGGCISYGKLGRFEDPEFVIRQAVIVTPYPGATAQEVSDEVTDVIEGAVQALQELKEVKSVSMQGRSDVTVEIKLEFAQSSAQVQQVWDKLRRKVADAQRQLPPVPALQSSTMTSLTCTRCFTQLPGKALATNSCKTTSIRYAVNWFWCRLGKAATLAEQQEAIFIEMSSSRMAEFGLSVERVLQVLQKQSLVTVAGSVDAQQMRIPVIPKSNISSLADLTNLQVAVGSNNAVVRLGDIANISRGYTEPASMLMRYNGQRAIGFSIFNVTGGNVVEMGDAVKARLAELESQRPLGMDPHVISMQSDSVRASVDNFIDNLIAAVFIVFVVLLLFMGVPSGVIIGFVLLLIVAGTLCVMLIDDIAMQRISLRALIIALGMLVDNAIVVTDGVLVRFQQDANADKQQVVSEVVNATKWPLLGGTVVGILPSAQLASPFRYGRICRLAILGDPLLDVLSWVFAVTVTPCSAMTFYALKLPPKRRNRLNW